MNSGAADRGTIACVFHLIVGMSEIDENTTSRMECTLLFFQMHQCDLFILRRFDRSIDRRFGSSDGQCSSGRNGGWLSQSLAFFFSLSLLLHVSIVSFLWIFVQMLSFPSFSIPLLMRVSCSIYSFLSFHSSSFRMKPTG